MKSQDGLAGRMTIEAMSPRVAIIIVIWNGKTDTIECLDSLSKDTYSNKETIVVDNGSTDDSLEEIRRTFPEVVIVETGANLGFTGGNNAGIRYALENGSEYVFLLNNDTTVEPEALSKLVAAAESNQRWGLLAPVIHCYYPPREIWFANSKMDLHRGAAWHDNSRPPERSDDPYEVPWATGCAMLVRASIMHKTGGFDDRYYLSWEDVDLCLRVREMGLLVAAVPAARIYHKGGKSGQRMPESHHYYSVRNSLLTVRKHEKGLGYWWAAMEILLLSLRRCRGIYKEEPAETFKYLRTVLNGLQDHLLGRYGAYRPR